MSGAASVRLDAVLFDLDGTLIDSIRLILDSYHHTLRAHGKPSQTDAEVLAHVGTPLRAHVALYATDDAEAEAMVATYLDWNRAAHDRSVRAFVGIVGAITDLRASGVRMGVVTSKRSIAARRGLDLCGLGGVGESGAHFELLVGCDDVERHKPHPEPLLAALERMGVPPSRAAYVGDSPHDLVAAGAAGVLRVAAGWGPFERAALDAAGHDLWMERPADLAQLAR